MTTLNAWHYRRMLRLGLALACGLALLLGLLLVMGAAHSPEVALAQGSITRYVAPAPTGNDSGNDCTNSTAPCATVQHAVDEADPGDEIRVATGVYTDVQARAGITQVVYISKTVTVRGGYTTTNWSMSYPITQPTTLDAQKQGRVLYITGDVSSTIEGLRITGGDAAGLGGDPVAGCQDAGGGIYVITATATMSNNQMFGNTACDGGGLYFSGSANTILASNMISDNTGYNFAGGMYFRASSGATLVSNTIMNNVANFPGGGQKHCGGVYFVFSDNATLIGNTISGNTAANSGGGACFGSSDNAMLVGNTVISNSRLASWLGGGIGLHLQNSQNANLVGNTISNNGGKYVGSLGTILGGGLYIDNSTVTLMSNKISSNQATRGGGLYVGSNSTVMLASNIVTGNVVYDSSGHQDYDPVGYGGGLYLNNSTATLTNTVVADNQAGTTGNGSGLYIAGCSPQLLHTTIARNTSGDGSGVYITGTNSTVALTNTILVSHTVGITVTAGNTAILNGILWYSNTINYGGEGTITITNEYTGNPAFADDGYHLIASSEAIDKGVNAGVDDDVDGDPRPMGHGYDLGADELRIALTVTKQADPDLADAGAPLTYTLRVTNTGSVTLTATITDVLPEHVTPTGVFTRTPTIPAPGGVWTDTVVVTVEVGYVGTLTNVVQVTTDEGAMGVYTMTSEAQIAPAPPVPPIYLPLVLRNSG